MSYGVNIQIYGTIILLVVLYGCAACSLILREHRLGCQAKVVLRNVFRLREENVTANLRKFCIEVFCYLYITSNIILELTSRTMKLSGVWYIWDTRTKQAGFWSQNLKERDRLEDM
jgi:hypothetical protein